jgi:hypothetical protein
MKYLQDLFPARFASKMAMFDNGTIPLPGAIAPVVLKILIVVDGVPDGHDRNISFNHHFFGLSTLLDTLRNNPEYFVKFDVVRAHRQKDHRKPDSTDRGLFELYCPHYESFRFTEQHPQNLVTGQQDNFNLDSFNLVWLFGMRTESEGEGLTDDEVAVVSNWMNDVRTMGGVFASGDHFDTGAALCSRVPRVRTMRAWTANQIPAPPPLDGVLRHDTLVKGHDGFFASDDESDDEPMKIKLRTGLTGTGGIPDRVNQPHPILCGTAGVIDILPDHGHEGTVIEDSQVNIEGTVDFGEFKGQPEYPTLNGTRPRPQVIADAEVMPGHDGGSYYGRVQPGIFGAIGTYDGHDAQIGRVVVDSSWHHWFDVNLTGRESLAPGGPAFPYDDPKHCGFLFSVQGREHLARIQNYFRNVAIWLAPPMLQQKMFVNAAWGCVRRYPLAEEFREDLPTAFLGPALRTELSRRVSRGIVSEWLINSRPSELHNFLKSFEEFGENATAASRAVDLLESLALGGAAQSLLKVKVSDFVDVATASHLMKDVVSSDKSKKQMLGSNGSQLTDQVGKGPTLLKDQVSLESAVSEAFFSGLDSGHEKFDAHIGAFLDNIDFL